MARPMTQFCCGCELAVGAYLVVITHLLFNIFYIATAISNVILRIPTFGFSAGLTALTFNGSFSLFGLPFLISALYGIYYRLEPNLRLYLGYLGLSFALDIFYVVSYFFLNDACADLPQALEEHGDAFACGFMRITALGFVIVLTVTELYAIFTVWSFCEDLKAGGGGIGFKTLLAGAETESHKMRYTSPQYEQGYGYAGGQNFPAAYGTVKGPAIGGSSTIFAGEGGWHDTAYPPRPDKQR